MRHGVAINRPSFRCMVTKTDNIIGEMACERSVSETEIVRSCILKFSTINTRSSGDESQISPEIEVNYGEEFLRNIFLSK